MPLRLPSGRNLAVCIGPDFDAHALWMGTFNAPTPSHLSRGEFGAEVGVPRLLDLFARYGITTTWCVPSHTLLTFPERARQIAEAGHEIAAHGCYHEQVRSLEPAEERRLLELQLAHHVRVLGSRPTGYRSPAWDFSDSTLGLLEEYGFVWDSSLMGRDFEVYRPRPVVVVDGENGNVFGPPSRLLEIPVSWYLDDFPALDQPPRVTGLGSTEVVFERWRDHADYARAHVPGGVYVLTVHPQTIGRAHGMLLLERLIEYLTGLGDVWFARLSDIAAAWVDEDGPGR